MTEHCGSLLPLVHQVAVSDMLCTVTAAPAPPTEMARPLALLPPKLPEMVALPGCRGRKRLRRLVLPRLALNLMVVRSDEVMLVLGACMRAASDSAAVMSFKSA